MTTQIKRVAVIGTGVIGASLTALLASEALASIPNPAPSWGQSPRCKRLSRLLPRIEE